MGSFLISSNVNAPDSDSEDSENLSIEDRADVRDAIAATRPRLVLLVAIGAFLPVDGGFRVALPPDLVQLPFRVESERNPNGFQTTSARIPNDCARGHVARLHRRTP